MKKCVNCGAELIDGALFCCKCGTKVEEKLFCSKCGRELPAKDALFCPFCGQKVGESLNNNTDATTADETKEPVIKADPVENVADEAQVDDLAEKCEEALEYFNAGDYVNAFALFKAAADQKNAEAQYYLGSFYMSGYGVEPDTDEAAKWIKRSAKQGYPDGQCALGNCFHNGWGVDADDDKAYDWYVKSVKNGSIWGEYQLAECYLNGWSDKAGIDEECGMDYLRDAAEKGLPNAQYRLADELLKNGTDDDDAEIVKWYSAAAEQGNAAGQYAMYGIYSSGEMGVEADEETANDFLEKSLEQGYSLAHNDIAAGAADQGDFETAVHHYLRFLGSATKIDTYSPFWDDSYIEKAINCIIEHCNYIDYGSDIIIQYLENEKANHIFNKRKYDVAILLAKQNME